MEYRPRFIPEGVILAILIIGAAVKLARIWGLWP